MLGYHLGLYAIFIKKNIPDNNGLFFFFYFSIGGGGILAV